MKNLFFAFLLLGCAAAIFAAAIDSPYLYGIHWYGKTDSISVGQRTDVEDMSGDKGIWDLEIAHVDSSAAPAWDLPSYFVGHSQKVTQGKGNSLIFRLHPYWSRNVPHASDPYTLTQYANDCKSAANTLKDYVHIWQIGNEVNINGENNRWGGSGYNVPWEPTPAQYADTYIACRDKIHEITPNTTPAAQFVLMQPVSPGNAIGGTRYMDGNEFLWRQIDAVSDKGKIDGFGIHAYAPPSAADYGVESFMDDIREQLMIIDQFGLGDRPVFITEWNKHMPNQAHAEIGAKFCHRIFTALNAWNTGSGGEWPGHPNHNIVAATWFVYPKDFGWDEYALQYWKTQIASTDKDVNPWYSFNYACGLGYASGAYGGGSTSIPNNALWWEDTFNGASLDQTAPLPDWKAETSGGGSVSMSGSGSVRLLGNGTTDGGGGIRTAGYVYGNFRMEANVTFTNAARSNTSGAQANMDIRIHEGSKGYSFTFFTSQSLENAGRVILRRTNEWTQIGSFNTAVSGGINTGDTFQIEITANGSNIAFKAYKNGSTAPSVDWNITDSGQTVGWIRIMTWNLNEARVNNFKLGGPQWGGSGIEDWAIY